MMKQTLSMTRKELNSYFGSPMALIFLGAFLAAALFSFFWVNTFFARGIADVRPLFEWMPILMIFLVAALTMRQWSEEQQSGTLEILLTLPVRGAQLVIGKFVAVMALIALALALTIFLPITVSVLGNLDWGPVIGGYLAALLMAAAYVAIGLFVSSRTDNQIVSLIVTVLVCGFLYVVGSRGVTDFVGGGAADILRALGVGSRFQSIERGIIDLRDLIYYLSLTAVFLLLNILSLDSHRWSSGQNTAAYRRNWQTLISLVTLNLVALNVWLYPISSLRLDLTSQREYSLSPATRDLLSNLQEPLLLRAYMSEKTHPLLAPLAPRVRDMLTEYQIASRGKVTAEVVDPLLDSEKETEANQTYGIQSTPLQVAGRYEASVINAYFDILVRYGDQNVTLNFRDLIEVAAQRDGNVDVRLRNLEYDLTRAVKKVVYGFQSVDSVLAAVADPVTLTLFVTPNTLPPSLQEAQAAIEKVAREIQARSNGKFTFQVIDPDAPGAAVNRQTLINNYKLRPIPVSLFAADTYYLDMILQVGDKSQVISPSSDFSEANVRTAIEAALKRSSSGFLKVVGLWTPPQQPADPQFGQTLQSTFQALNQQLSRDYTVRAVDLKDGQAPADVDVLVIVAPQNMDDKQRFAIDQFLMRGGAVVVAAGNYTIAADQFGGGLGIQPLAGGLQEMLQSYGITVTQALVMDPQNEPFPVAVNRDVGGIQVREIQAINYPFFVDVRSSGMNKNSPIVSSLAAVTLHWVSPVVADAARNSGRTVTPLLTSSAQSWLRTSTDIQPNLQLYPETGFAVEGERRAHTLAVAVQGTFDSFFEGKTSPLTAAPAEPGQVTPAPQTSATIESSPATARLVVIGSSEFVDDIVFQISSNLTQDRYLNSLQFMQNAVDWSVEDLDLLTIRSRGTQSRVLEPMTSSQQSTWEVANYAVALLALAGIGALWTLRRRSEKPMTLVADEAGG